MSGVYDSKMRTKVETNKTPTENATNINLTQFPSNINILKLCLKPENKNNVDYVGKICNNLRRKMNKN